MPLIGAAYLRCSDPRQDKSIDQQRAEIERRAAADGVVIPPENWFIDEGISGRSTKRRDSYLRLLRRAEAQVEARRSRRANAVPPIDRLYVWAFSRIARNMFDCLRALGALDDADIEVVSLTEQDPADRSLRKLIRPILAWLAERYSEELAANVQRGMRSQAEKGLWMYGNPPFGYAVVDGRLAVTDETRTDFEAARRVFRLADESGDGAKRIAECLTRAGVAPPSRGDLPRQHAGHAWRAKHIASIVKNEVYLGHVLYDGEVVAEDAHPAATDRATFERIQAKRALRAQQRQAGKGNGASRLSASERGLFTPYLRCGACGSAIHVSAGGNAQKRTWLYYCRTRTDNRAACTGISARVEALDQLLLDRIESELLSEEAVGQLIADGIARLASAPADQHAATRAALQTELDGLDRRIRRVAAQVLDELIDEDDARALTAPLRARREQARLELASLPSPQPVPAADHIDSTAFREAVLEAWHARPLEDRRAALARLIDEITLSPGGVVIRYGYHHHDPQGPP